MAKKYVYSFGGGKADGKAEMKNLLGGKGANLAEMAGHKDLRLPVPPGFTVTTDVCTYFYANRKKYPSEPSGPVNSTGWLNNIRVKFLICHEVLVRKILTRKLRMLFQVKICPIGNPL